jgi:hypothetical protein
MIEILHFALCPLAEKRHIAFFGFEVALYSIDLALDHAGSFELEDTFNVYGFPKLKEGKSYPRVVEFSPIVSPMILLYV